MTSETETQKLKKEILKEVWNDNSIVSDADVNDDYCRKHKEELYEGYCPDCVGELIEKAIDLTLKSKEQEITSLKEKLKKGRNYKTNFWELYHPDGTSSMTNYNPVEELKEKLKNMEKEIDDVFIQAYKKCKEGLRDIQNEKPRENNTPRDWEQRIDEILLDYSSIKKISFNDAKKELEQKLFGDSESKINKSKKGWGRSYGY